MNHKIKVCTLITVLAAFVPSTAICGMYKQTGGTLFKNTLTSTLLFDFDMKKIADEFYGEFLGMNPLGYNSRSIAHPRVLTSDKETFCAF